MMTFLENAARCLVGFACVTVMGSMFCAFAGITMWASPALGVGAFFVLEAAGRN